MLVELILELRVLGRDIASTTARSRAVVSWPAENRNVAVPHDRGDVRCGSIGIGRDGEVGQDVLACGWRRRSSTEAA